MEFLNSIDWITWLFVGLVVWLVLFIEILKMVSISEDERKLEQEIADYENKKQ